MAGPTLDDIMGSSSSPDITSGFTLDDIMGASAPKKKPTGGWISNTISGATGVVTGIPGMAKAIYHDPVGTAKAAAVAEKDKWAPFLKGYADLAQGDLEGYRRNKKLFDAAVKADPLGTGLDLTFFLGGGAGRIAALSRLPAGATKVEVARAALRGKYIGPRRTITHQLAEGSGTVVGRVLPESAARAGRMQATDKLLKAVTRPETPKIGEHARAARAAKNETRQVYLNHIASQEAHDFGLAWNKLSNRQKMVFYWHNRFAGSTDDLARYKEQLRVRTTPEARQTLALLDNPAFMKQFRAPADKLHAALDAGKALSESRTGIALRHNAITQDGAALAPFRHIRMVRGGHFLTRGQAHKQIRKIDAEIARLSGVETRKIMREARRGGGKVIYQAEKAAAKTGREQAANEKKIQQMSDRAVRVGDHQEYAQNLADQLGEVMRGNLDVNTVSAMGEKLPTGTTIRGEVATSILEAEFKKEIVDLQAKRARYEPDPAKLQEFDDKIAANNRQKARLNPTHQQPWIDRLERENSSLQGQKDRLVRVQAPARDRLDERIAKVQRDIQSLSGDTLIDPRWEDIRIRTMGRLNDKLESATRRLERSMAASHGFEDHMFQAQELAARKAGDAKAVKQAREARIRLLQQQRQKYIDLLDMQEMLQVSKQQLKDRVGQLHGGGQLPDLKAEIARRNAESLAAGGRGVREPFYVPDVAASKRYGRKQRVPAGSIAPTDPRAGIRDTRGILFRTGMLAANPDVLTPSFLAMAKHDYYTALHQKAKTMAVPVPPNTQLPDGMVWLKTRYGQSVPILEQMRGEHLRETGAAFSDLPDDLKFTSAEKNLPMDQIEKNTAGMRLAVPEQFAKEFESEFGKQAGGITRFAQSALTVWRALILHLRIPWLVNNVVGNAMLTTLRYMGVDGMKAVLGLIHDTKGVQGVRKALGMRDVRHALSEQDMRELAGSQIRGTFMGANLEVPRWLSERIPDISQPAARKTVQAGGKALGFLPSIDRRTEQFYRRLATQAVLRGSPEVKAFYRQMPKQTRSWREAMRHGLGDQTEHQFTMREVNDGLGDFLTLSRGERDLVRQLVPFYAWMREITRITGKTAVDTPGRAAVLSQLAQVTQEETVQDVPFYMQGAIPYGKTSSGLQQSLNLRATLPWSSVVNSATALGFATPWGGRNSAREVSSETNPFLADLVKLLGDAQQGRSPTYGGLAQPFVDVAENLPQVRALFPGPSKMYPDRTQQDLLLQLLGDPRRTYDPRYAKTR